ncbi:Rap1-interacting factor 1 N terminal-domain-containing protein [Xylaria bambusicola]|uniref:Rap1-interacting factor 1 N terminal-domain-containing protein n=1 Tax=Xylaria bambusicola TaxID=326684 RepID=UPI0020077601|nr:Rap1-interacting factor 1 N terminal-domain-containing protein [Xylaria bambusicola]KAI0521473.1 Rap1-interacting factor 1 N terminal-domain-containing protein [Xylaria bambusicola]
MVSPVAPPSAGLDALLARPPTPPRERQSDLDSKSNLNQRLLSSRPTLQTPPSHSPGSALSTNASSRRSRKRVEFTVHTEYCDPPTKTGKENEHKRSTPISASSSMRPSRPLKSILKPTSSPNPPNPLDPSAGYGEAGSTITLAAMLESSIKHLASNDRDNKVDAYTMLARALKTSTNLPDRIALQSKMSLFVQFIQRDITTKAENGAIDTSLINHALTLLSTFLHFPSMATAVSSDFGVFIIDHCIRSFEDTTVPKDVVRHLMQVVVCQDFPPKVMTADRVGRLVTSLHNIENHIKGKSIIMSRILIYRRLLKQSTIHMVSHSEWLLDLFTDMLSSMKEIRSAAIALGLDASFTAAKEKQLPKKVMEVLQMSVDETRYIEYYIQRLSTMSKERSEMAAVPQIWSVIVLLLRCPIDRWEFFDQWLKIIQRCFNSSDYQTRLEAHFAWNRLVYVLHLHEPSFSKTINTLCQPFTQLKRGRQSDEFRKVVIGGLCNLYYYAFKPNSSSMHVGQYWDACVQTLLRTLAFPEVDGKPAEKQQAFSTYNLSQAANILAGLFDSSSVRIWKEDRIAESTVAKATELPPLDPKWIRRNTTRVFTIVQPLLSKSFLELANFDSSSSRLWKSLVSAVAAAASKEVKVSVDTVAFLGSALSLLMRIWTTGLGEARTPADMQQPFLKATESYLTTLVLSLGHLPFTEKPLSMSEQNTLVPIATPSHRSRKGHGPTRSPLHHLFSILSSLPPGISDGEDLINLFKTIFEPFMLTRSPRGRSDLAHELMQIPPLGDPVTHGPWAFIAEALSTPSGNSQSSNSSDSTSQPPIGNEFRDIVRHLEKGINYAPNLPWAQWLSLFHFAVEQATELSGEAGCSVAVIEPLAKATLQALPTETSLITPDVYKCGVQLICNAKLPRDRQALDAARRRLWGTTVAGPRSASFDPFDSLYRLVSRLLEAGYTTVDKLDANDLATLITETSHYLLRANRTLVFKSLVQLQHGLGPWIQDVDERYSSKQRSIIAEAVKSSWERICSLFSDAMLEHFQLDAIEPLLCCAFRSKHRHIVNNAVLLWNRSFDSASEVDYPATLKNVLLSLRSYVEITLPGLDNSTCETNDYTPMFLDSQDDFDVMTTSKIMKVNPILNDSVSPRNLETPRSKQISLSNHNKSDDLLNGSSKSARSTRSIRSTRSSTRNRITKPRHEDSQIQFAHIEESSPSTRPVESQVLTDRQKEIRERQLENAALFPIIQSSIEKVENLPTFTSTEVSPQRSDLAQPPIVDHSATPRATRSNEYLSSTPTPRRGQHIMIEEDHEMTDDIPSSPPEPRRNLLPEMKLHSRDTRMLDDMPISSSPVSGSPVSKKVFLYQNEQAELQEYVLSLSAESISSQHMDSSMQDSAINEPELYPADRECTTIKDRPVCLPMIQPSEIPVIPNAAKVQGAPRSDAEMFVDAPISLPATELPTRENATAQVDLPEDDENVYKDRSFEMSDGEERSMARLVIELDSRKCEPLPTYEAASPEKIHTIKDMVECITVHTKSDQGQPQQSQNPSNPSIPPITVTLAKSDNSQSSEKRFRKRKRTSDRKQHNSGKKRKHLQANGDDTDLIMDSQAPLVDHQQPTESLPTEAGENIEREEIGSTAYSQGSPDLSYNPDDSEYIAPLDLDDDGTDSDTAAVNLQLITEASQQSEADGHSQFIEASSPESTSSSDVDAAAHRGREMEDNRLEAKPSNRENDTLAQVELSVVEKIAASLRDGLDGLRSATISREDVYKIESMFMDIKNELYAAEARSRR